MDHSLPAALPGIAWEVSPIPGGLLLRASAGTDIAGAGELKLREVAPCEFRADLACSIDPSFAGRGLGTAILAWSEAASTDLFQSAGHSGSLTLCANTSAPDEPSRVLLPRTDWNSLSPKTK